MPDLKCEVPDLLLKVVDLKQEVSDLRSGGIPLNLTPAFTAVCPPNSEKHVFEVCQWSEVSVFRLIWKTATKTEVGRTDLSNCVTSAASDRTGRQSMTDTQTLTLGGESADGTREWPIVDVAESLVFVERVDSHESSAAHIAAVLGSSARCVACLMTLQDGPRVRSVRTRAALVATFTLH